jgi:YegS/Rv2252/BmrU family lipid kinase
MHRPMTRALVLGRLRKGRRIREVVGQVEQLLVDAGWKVDAAVVKRKRDLRRRAADAVKEGCEVVVAVGGDGAVLQVATSLVKTKVALGIIPMGTGNLLAGNLKIPTEQAKAVQALLDGRHRRIDVGRVTVAGGKHYTFTVACGVGFDAKVMQKTGAGQKRRWGKLAYFANAISEAGGIRNVPHQITLDGAETTTEAAQVLIANFGRMSAGVTPDRAIEPDDGILDVIAVRASGRLSGLLAGWEALRQTHLGESVSGRAMRAQAREVRVETNPSQLVEVDGSVVGKTPITASIVPDALTVIVPAK